MDKYKAWSYVQILLSYMAGGLLAFGWWCFFDAVCEIVKFHLRPENANKTVAFLGYFIFWLPGVIVTVSHVLINIVPWTALAHQPFGMDMVSLRARIWLMIAFIIGFVGLIMSFWFAIEFFLWNNPHADFVIFRAYWQPVVGVEIILQSVSIFLSAVLFRFGPRMVLEKKDDMDDF